MTQYDAGPGDWSDRPWEDPDKKPRPQARRRVTLPPWALLAILVGVIILLCVGLVMIVQAIRRGGEEETPVPTFTSTAMLAATDTAVPAGSTATITPTATMDLPISTPESTPSGEIIEPGVTVVVRLFGFIEGEILVPEFVLTELQNIADSSNSLRRRKGRRGLEILRELMQDDSVKIRVVTQDYPSIKEVDRKLIRLVKEQNGTLVTTDYNLNRVAQVEGIRILNINELANAVKPPFIPGEEIAVEVIDRGEEIGQGVGYLDDGTMVVVENGRRHIGRKIKAMVKSTLQTEAGRMLFVEPAGENPRWEK